MQTFVRLQKPRVSRKTTANKQFTPQARGLAQSARRGKEQFASHDKNRAQHHGSTPL